VCGVEVRRARPRSVLLRRVAREDQIPMAVVLDDRRHARRVNRCTAVRGPVRLLRLQQVSDVVTTGLCHTSFGSGTTSLWYVVPDEGLAPSFDARIDAVAVWDTSEPVVP